MKQFDVVIIGAGPGGYVAAIRAAQRGASTALIEKNELGGCCLNAGCIPTKAVLHVAELFEGARQLKKFTDGIDVPQADYAKVRAYKDKAVMRLVKGVEFLMKHSGVEVFKGTGVFKDRQHIDVSSEEGTETIQFGKAIIATGGEPIVPPVFKDTDAPIMTSTEALDLTELPSTIAIIGGGYIGCEFASAFSALGAEVTVVEMLDSLIPRMDPDQSKELARAFKKKKISVLTGSEVVSVKKAGKKIALDIKGTEGLKVDAVLLAIGRRPYSDGLGLENIGLEADRGAVPVNEFCETEVPGVYAIGDVTGKILLAHAASAQAKVAAENCTGGHVPMNYSIVPAALFTDPEVSSVGLTPQEAEEQGKKFKSITFPYKALGRAVSCDAVNGFVKILYDPEINEILGAHIIGRSASDLIAICALCMKMEGTLESLAETIFVHPTFAESIMEAAEGGLGEGVHFAG
ncbi:dihydrolipoyl dehydrogenase [Planctomycetota bacterium]